MISIVAEGEGGDRDALRRIQKFHLLLHTKRVLDNEANRPHGRASESGPIIF
jgi:hypothetical protein